jgi:hypothetical protein
MRSGYLAPAAPDQATLACAAKETAMGGKKNEATERLLYEAHGLGLRAGQYAIFGSGPMGVRGLREIHDVDVIAALREHDPAAVAKHEGVLRFE